MNDDDVNKTIAEEQPTETKIRRTMAHWLNIEYITLTRMLKSNSLLLTNLNRIISELKG